MLKNYKEYEVNRQIYAIFRYVYMQHRDSIFTPEYVSIFNSHKQDIENFYQAIDSSDSIEECIKELTEKIGSNFKGCRLIKVSDIAAIPDIKEQKPSYQKRDTDALLLSRSMAAVDISGRHFLFHPLNEQIIIRLEKLFKLDKDNSYTIFSMILDDIFSSDNGLFDKTIMSKRNFDSHKESVQDNIRNRDNNLSTTTFFYIPESGSGDTNSWLDKMQAAKIILCDPISKRAFTHIDDCLISFGLLNDEFLQLLKHNTYYEQDINSSYKFFSTSKNESRQNIDKFKYLYECGISNKQIGISKNDIVAVYKIFSAVVDENGDRKVFKNFRIKDIGDPVKSGSFDGDCMEEPLVYIDDENFNISEPYTKQTHVFINGDTFNSDSPYRKASLCMQHLTRHDDPKITLYICDKSQIKDWDSSNIKEYSFNIRGRTHECIDTHFSLLLHKFHEKHLNPDDFTILYSAFYDILVLGGFDWRYGKDSVLYLNIFVRILRYFIKGDVEFYFLSRENVYRIGDSRNQDTKTTDKLEDIAHRLRLFYETYMKICRALREVDGIEAQITQDANDEFKEALTEILKIIKCRDDKADT